MSSNPAVEKPAILNRVTNRWRALAALRRWTVAAAGASVVLLLALVANAWAAPEGIPLVVLWTIAAISVFICAGWAVAFARRIPAEHQVARFIEERCPELEDVLATAVSRSVRDIDDDPMARMVLSDAARRTEKLELDRIISRAMLHRTVAVAGVSTVALALLAGLSLPPAGHAARLLALYLFPHRLTLDVTPGDVRVSAGSSVHVVARTSGGVAVVPILHAEDSGTWRDMRMEAMPGGGFAVVFERVQRDFRYVVDAAGTSSPEYVVTVVRPPRVERIDLRYDYPAGFGMPPRTEEDGGDIYGPEGTRVRVRVHADKPVTRAMLMVAGADPTLLRMNNGALEGELTIGEDSSYRVALADTDGLTNPGEIEYFIRALQDRPPDVRITRPTGDRQVTPVEEVPIEARAEDDYGIRTLDLVYTVGGGAEHVVPLVDSKSGTSAVGRETVYLEDLKVRPGDLISYYARARDVGRGKRPNEARSDIFFLEVTPFDEEFVASQSGASGGNAGGDPTIEELLQGQKDIITATWNLDRRARETRGRSEGDIRAVGRAQRELRTRATEILGRLRRTGDIRRRRQGLSTGADPNTEVMVEAIERAAHTMGKAEEHLEALKTADALPQEMAALHHLLRAQAEIRRREVQRQQATGGGSGRFTNRQEQDLSQLFDRELARQQQTNYETPVSHEERDEEAAESDAIEKIRDLARRQEDLNRSQEEVAAARASTPDDENRRQLERLTREQSELRREAEELAQQLQRTGQSSQSRQGEQRTQSGQRGQSGENGQRANGEDRQQAGRELERISEEMQGAARELRRANPEQASLRGNEAAQRLRDLGERLGEGQPDNRRRALGDLQLESRQLADAQRSLAAAPASAAAGDRADAARRRAAAQERLADRTERLENAIRQLARESKGANERDRNALTAADRELDQQRPSDRMRRAANAARRSTETPGGAAQRESENIARALDRLADRLAAATGHSEDSQRLTEDVSRIRDLREQLTALDRRLAKLRAEAGSPNSNGKERDGGSQSAGGGISGGSQSPWQEAREWLESLRRDERLEGPTPDVAGFNPGLSAPGTESWKQDFATWDALKVQVAAALERAEQTAVARLREHQAKNRLDAGLSQAVPAEYQRMVEKYYRALASRSQEKR
jgi:hypothetical protein